VAVSRRKRDSSPDLLDAALAPRPLEREEDADVNLDGDLGMAAKGATYSISTEASEFPKASPVSPAQCSRNAAPMASRPGIESESQR